MKHYEVEPDTEIAIGHWTLNTTIRKKTKVLRCLLEWALNQD